MPPLQNAALVGLMCERNIDFAWQFHFLHGLAFMYWEMRHSVRSNQSEAIDLIWREAVAFLHTDGALVAFLHTSRHFAGLLGERAAPCTGAGVPPQSHP
eukprot:6177075-Pleurochrysis_carterae.AAC.1